MAALAKRLPRTVLPPLSRAMWGAVEPAAQSLIVPLSNYSEPPVMTTKRLFIQVVDDEDDDE